MKRFILYIVGWVALLPGFIACEQKPLFLDPLGIHDINVEIHWDNVPDHMLPKNMTVHWYPEQSPIVASDMHIYGGKERLSRDVHDVMCMDFNGPVTLSFRSNGTREDFEVFNIQQTGTYNTHVPQLPDGEITVAEAYPYQFYIDNRSQTVDTKKTIPEDSVHTVHFYPQNVLKEFTFMVYDVVGAKYMSNNSGAISGMSGSYFPATGELASTPSTILFSRVETIKDAQTSPRWTEQEKALFAAKNPDWASTDTLVGWTRDWTTGKFVTFGPLDRDVFRFRLTVEALTQANNRFNGSWGYWNGQWENTVAAQIDSAMGTNGTLEEQLAWRQRNGGYDIILYNDHRLVIPEGEGRPGTTDGGFTVEIEGWGPMIEVPVGGNAGNVSPSAKIRSSVNTYETIPDFVLNGIHSVDGSFIFNEQYIYKPETGNPVWDYYPKKYWPQTGDVNFYAYAPAGIKDLNVGLNNNGSINTPPVIEYAMAHKNRKEPPPGTGELTPVLWVEELQEDLLVAVQKRSAPPTAVPVQMSFHHAFSRVTVKAKTDRDYGNNYRIKVVRVDLRNMYTSGELALQPDDGGANLGIPMNNTGFRHNGSLTLWENLDSLANYRFKLIEPAVPINNKYTTLLENNSGIFVIPQEARGGNRMVYVEYDVYTNSDINGEKYHTTEKKLLPLNTGANEHFEIGRQYELQLTLDIPGL